MAEHDRPARVEIGGVEIDIVDTAALMEQVVSAASDSRGGWVITANLDHLRRAHHEADYRAMLSEADWVVADGMPLVWASRLQGRPLPERVAGSSLVDPLAGLAAKRGLSLYLLGGNPGVADQAAAVLQERHAGLKIAGTHCPPMGFEHDDAEMEKIRGSLISSDPDIVYVALGSPKQELLIREVRSVLPSACWLGVGISLSFLTGEVQRAPSFLQRVGLEWVHRLIQEPRRLAKRYLVQGLPFACRLGFGALAKRWVGRSR